MADKRKRLLEADGATRKQYPMARGLLDYFPDALAEVAKLSYQGNQKHNPGEEMHHARGKSMDHADCIIRHLVGRGGFDGDTRESAALAWRALALLQEELEREYALALPRGARPAEETPDMEKLNRLLTVMQGPMPPILPQSFGQDLKSSEITPDLSEDI